MAFRRVDQFQEWVEPSTEKLTFSSAAPQDLPSDFTEYNSTKLVANAQVFVDKVSLFVLNNHTRWEFVFCALLVMLVLYSLYKICFSKQRLALHPLKSE